MIKRTVAVIGCGPVGLFASHLLKQCNIDYVTLQKFASPRAHPSAHWISASSKLLLNQIPNLNKNINQNQQDWSYYQYYRYSQGLFGQQIGKTDHFTPSITQKLETSFKLFSQYPSHIPQNKLLEVMYDLMDSSQCSQNFKFNQNISSIQFSETNSQSLYTLYNNNKQKVAQSKYVILCNGVNSSLRNNYVQMKGQDQIMNIINIHFTSKKLGSIIKNSQRKAMLHFFYGGQMLGVLVNHSIEEGVFVMQVPNFIPLLDLSQIYSGRQMIQIQQMCLGCNLNQFDDLKIIHIGKWKVQGILANKMHHGNIILAGDAAHAYPPAGGFGMNSGFQDINEAIHTIRSLQRNKGLNSHKVLGLYNDNRLAINKRYLQKSIKNLNISKQIASKLGYPSKINDYFLLQPFFQSLISMLPKSLTSRMEQMRLKVMQVAYRKRYLGTPELQLFFDDFDIQAQRASKVRNIILAQFAQNKKTLWVKKGVQYGQIQINYGKVENNQIRYFDPQIQKQYENAQKIITSSGVVILQ